MPPAVVVDAHDVCRDLDQAQASLREALGGSVAPVAGWRLRVIDERRGSHVFVTANLDDATGNAVAHREIEAKPGDQCEGIMSAVGVWAGLRLDAEVVEAKAHPKPALKPVEATEPGKSNAQQATVPLPTPVDADAGVNAPHAKAIEVGANATLMNSPVTTQDAALVGGTVFVLAEVVRSFFLRPAVMAAASIGGTATYFGTRLDACLRVPGNYTEHRGLLLDLCAGTELAAIDHPVATTFLVHQIDVMFAIGPSLALRGDLASDLSVEVRGSTGFNVGHTDQSITLLSLRAEVGFTWRLR